ncbi:hypothetical protein T10_808 [Trichinella papuae]|uniref:Uncharacterized protein n=1 Tax=Trichinella papuae TaxID=268474 RepID=A0A0V1N1V0_9BILA|nr:hypothetical protein T10_808 [Trichinella papuae]
MFSHPKGQWILIFKQKVINNFCLNGTWLAEIAPYERKINAEKSGCSTLSVEEWSTDEGKQPISSLSWAKKLALTTL